jgi:glycosyltransferase involved in cell wall biosynthesis
MLDTVAELIPNYPDIKLHVVGVGKGVTIKGRFEFVKWAGDLNYIQMREFYRKMDLAIHIAKRDWCPNVVLEFMAAGIPTIVSDKGGGATELVNLVDPERVSLDDNDPIDIKPVEQYSKAWNVLSPDFRTNVQSKIQRVYHDRNRVKLPLELTAGYVAEQYLDFMRRFI